MSAFHFPSDANAVFDFVDFAANREATQAHPYVRNQKDTETQRRPEQSKMIRGQTTKLKDEFRCLSPDCSGLLCVSVSLWFQLYVIVVPNLFSSGLPCRRLANSPRKFLLF